MLRTHAAALHYKTYRYARCCALRITCTYAEERVLSLVCISINTRSSGSRRGVHPSSFYPPLEIIGRGLCREGIFGDKRGASKSKMYIRCIGEMMMFLQPRRKSRDVERRTETVSFFFYLFMGDFQRNMRCFKSAWSRRFTFFARDRISRNVIGQFLLLSSRTSSFEEAEFHCSNSVLRYVI